MPAPPMDVFGIVYIIETAQQFWSELEEILHIQEDCTLSQLDDTLRRYITFCAAYHEQFLQSPLQLEHACDMLLGSELFAFHSERMSDLLTKDAQTVRPPARHKSSRNLSSDPFVSLHQNIDDPHYEMILYSVMLLWGRRKSAFLRSQKRWKPLLPLLMDHVRLEVDPELDDGFYGTASGPSSGAGRAIAVPIEAKLRSLSVKLLYEVCRVQKMSLQDLRIFDDSFIDYLFDLVEQTRNMQDETFNYSVIKLIVALNEQFMVASLHPHTPQTQNGFAQQQEGPRTPEESNRVLRVLMSRVGSSPTFGENLIFMLNRADRTAEDLCMQLLVLKLLYLLFTTKGMSEFFYTNDLCVLVDVFLREICDIDEDNESLRHTYLRVLHPLLTKTQLRNMPYKRPQIVRTLESLIENESIRDIDPTTKRLVERCLSGDWCVQFRKSAGAKSDQRTFSMWEEDVQRGQSPGLDAVTSATAPHSAGPTSGSKPQLDRMGSLRGKNGKASRSAEHLPLPTTSSSSSSTQKPPRSSQAQHLHADEQPYRVSSRAVPPPSAGQRHASGDSVSSLPRVAAATANPHSAAVKHRYRAGSFDVEATTKSFAALSTSPEEQRSPVHIIDDSAPLVDEPTGGSPPEIRILSPTSPGQVGPRSPSERPFSLSSSASSSSSSLSNSTAGPSLPQRRAAPPPPAKKRRKPPAVPVGRGLGPGGSPLSSLAASSQPNLSVLSSGTRKASGF
ncbi:hypothetical protein OH77DRAFT_174652 [Trametes cingulata]|nr:hypothetical protein OH77DRAFT_174652 [Trametes cingulata]